MHIHQLRFRQKATFLRPDRKGLIIRTINGSNLGRSHKPLAQRQQRGPWYGIRRPIQQRKQLIFLQKARIQ